MGREKRGGEDGRRWDSEDGMKGQDERRQEVWNEEREEGRRF